MRRPFNRISISRPLNTPLVFPAYLCFTHHRELTINSMVKGWLWNVGMRPYRTSAKDPKIKKIQCHPSFQNFHTNHPPILHTTQHKHKAMTMTMPHQTNPRRESSRSLQTLHKTNFFLSKKIINKTKQKKKPNSQHTTPRPPLLQIWWTNVATLRKFNKIFISNRSVVTPK